MSIAEILYDNRLSDAVPVASSTATGYDVRHIADWRPYLCWKSGAGGTQTITVDCGAAKSADTIAVCGHNIATRGGSVSVECSSDNFAADITVAMSPFRPCLDRIIYQHFAAQTKRYWRIKITGLSAAPYIGLAVIGMRLTFPVPIEGEYAPVIETPGIDSTRSNAGHVLGIVARVTEISAKISMRQIQEAWYASNFCAAWSQHLAPGKPFFYAPDYSNSPLDVFLLGIDRDTTLAAELDLVARRRLDLDMTGVVDYAYATDACAAGGGGARIWSAAPNMLRARRIHGCVGTQTAALAFCGSAMGAYLGYSEAFDGTAWTAGGLNVAARESLGFAGTSTAGLAYGGSGDSGTVYLAQTYNGISWSVTVNMLLRRSQHGSAGTQTAALAVGGQTSGAFDPYGPFTYVASTEIFDGTTWASGASLVSGPRNGISCIGLNNAALAFGGRSDTTFLAQSSAEEYDGISWALRGSMIAARLSHGGAGTQSTGLSISGTDDIAEIASTEEYDSGVWSLASNVLTAREGIRGAGTQSAGLNCGGWTGTAYSSITEKYGP